MVKRIGDQLVDKGIISRDQLKIALTEQSSGEHLPLGKIVVKLGFTSEAVIRDALSESLGQESVDLGTIVPEPEALAALPVALARKFTVMPVAIRQAPRTLVLAMADTYNLPAIDRIRAHIGGGIRIEPLLSGEVEINNTIDQFYGYELSVDGILQEIETGEVDYESLQAEQGEYSQPLVRLVDAILADAVKREASDIHFEPEAGFLRLRYRIDGVLRQVRALHKDFWSAIVVRIKVMSGMDIAESRAPQDGRISLMISGRPIDFRVAAQPTTHGENIVLRVLDRERGIVPMAKLGLPDDSLAQLQLMMARPEGIIMVTGPTGSGKTTTLYSILSSLSTEQVNIMTLEDPVEYPMDLVRQTSVNEAVKLDFATGVRSMMRQDPDIILVGEIRDEDTAQMALRAAMTGHQVFTTLHTNSALGAVPRLLDIGVLPDILAGNIIGIVAQRLVRKLCTQCRQPYRPDAVERSILGIGEDEDIQLHRATGCPRCEDRGYKGRMSIMEVLRMNPELDELIACKATQRELRQLALAQGFVPLVEDGIRRIKQGVTSLEEVSRVIDMTGLVGEL
ncbi:MAG: secretion system protein E [Gammaproteobacteria bacterium]|nr:MAG: secretion system protein E [Gammaproteobacteria bacterium]